MFYKEIKESVLSGLRITFLEHLEAQILKIYPLSANHGYFEFLTLFRMGLFGTAYGWEGQKAPLPTVCQTSCNNETWHSIPYLKKIQKTYKLRDRPLDFCWYQHFFTGISNFCYIKKYRYRLHFNINLLFLLTFLEPLKVALINLLTSLMMTAKLVTLALFKKSILK